MNNEKYEEERRIKVTIYNLVIMEGKSMNHAVFIIRIKNCNKLLYLETLKILSKKLCLMKQGIKNKTSYTYEQCNHCKC